jgi:hypothetical protein
VTHLRQMTLDELQRRNSSPNTVRSYIHVVEEFARYFRRSPDQLGQTRFASIRFTCFPIASSRRALSRDRLRLCGSCSSRRFGDPICPMPSHFPSIIGVCQPCSVRMKWLGNQAHGVVDGQRTAVISGTGRSDRFDRAILRFSRAYADKMESDWGEL